MSYIDVTGRTEEVAIAKALEQLGMDRDEVSVEILERAKSGFLGIGSSPARVRVSYGPDEAALAEEKPVKPEPKPQPKKEEKPERAEKKQEKPENKPEKPEKKQEKAGKKRWLPLRGSNLPQSDIMPV